MIHVKEAHVVVYVMDAFSAFKIDDFTIISSAIKEGRPIVIAVNKWEAIKDEYKYKAKNYLKKQIDEHLGELNGYPLVFVSAKMGANLTELMDNIIQIYDKWNSRISTGLLNNWLDRFKKLDNLPKDK
jgi:GTP-binding protein